VPHSVHGPGRLFDLHLGKLRKKFIDLLAIHEEREPAVVKRSDRDVAEGVVLDLFAQSIAPGFVREAEREKAPTRLEYAPGFRHRAPALTKWIAVNGGVIDDAVEILIGPGQLGEIANPKIAGQTFAGETLASLEKRVEEMASPANGAPVTGSIGRQKLVGLGTQVPPAATGVPSPDREEKLPCSQFGSGALKKALLPLRILQPS